jgi:PhnB protein
MQTHWQAKGMPTLSASAVGGSKLIAFAEKVFGAKVGIKIEGPGGRIVHSEIRFGDDSLIMTADAAPESYLQPGGFFVYVPDVNATYAAALAAGATSQRVPEDQFYGDRVAAVSDEFGNRWTIATHVEDVSEEEMARRMAAMKPAG